jgi:hypothetical protein
VLSVDVAALSVGMAMPWPASPEFRCWSYGAWRIVFSSSKRSGGQGDPDPGVLDGGLVS